MKYIKLIAFLILAGSLPFFGSVPIASSSSSSAAAAAATAPMSDTKRAADTKEGDEGSDNDSGEEKHWVEIGDGIGGKDYDSSSIAFSPNGKFAATANYGYGGGGQWSHDQGSISMYKVDNNTGIFTPIPGSPFKMNEFPYRVTFSDDSKFVIADDSYAKYPANEIKNVFSVNQDTGVLTHIKDAPFLFDETNAQTYSSNGKFAASCNTSANEINIYIFNKAIRAFVPVQGSPFKAPGAAPDLTKYKDTIEGVIAFDPLNKFIAYISPYDEAISIYKFDNKTGNITLAPGFPLKITGVKITGAHLPIEGNDIIRKYLKVAFSPNGAFLAIACSVNEINMYKINRNSGALTEVEDSPFEVSGNERADFAFSPTNNFLAVLSTVIIIFEVNQVTGELTHITGKVLKGVRTKAKMKTTQESFKEFAAVAHPTEAGKTLGLGEAIPKTVEQLLAEYMSAQSEKEVAAPEENSADVAAQKAIEQTKQERDASAKISTQLFAAIENSDDVKAISEYLNPFTINARAADNRTPLIIATTKGRIEIVKALLAYQGSTQETAYHPAQAISVDADAQDYFRNTALILAINRERFDIALLLAHHLEKVNPKGFQLANKQKVSACSLINDKYFKQRNENKAGYKELSALLLNHCPPAQAKRKALGDEDEEKNRPTKKAKPDTNPATAPAAAADSQDVKSTTEKMNKDE